MQRTIGRGSRRQGSSIWTMEGRKGVSPVAQPSDTAPRARMALSRARHSWSCTTRNVNERQGCQIPKEGISACDAAL